MQPEGPGEREKKMGQGLHPEQDGATRRVPVTGAHVARDPEDCQPSLPCPCRDRGPGEGLRRVIAFPGEGELRDPTAAGPQAGEGRNSPRVQDGAWHRLSAGALVT